MPWKGIFETCKIQQIREGFSRLKSYYYCSQEVQDKTGDFSGVYVLGCFIFKRIFSEPTVKNQLEDLHIKNY